VRSRLSAVGSRTIRILEGAYWRFGVLFQTVRPCLADHPPLPRRLSGRSPQTVHLGLFRSPMSFASLVVLPCCFELGFVPRVGRSVVTTRPWQTRVGTLGFEFSVYAGFILQKKFYRLPFTLPLWSLNRSFNWCQTVMDLHDFNQSKIQRWHTRNGVWDLHTLMVLTTRCGKGGWLLSSVARVRSCGMSR
jgi:hypothetical protein